MELIVLTDPILDTIANEFLRIFGAPPKGIHLVGSQAEGAATANSDIDIFLETDLPLGALTKFTSEGFEFLKAINPGKVPDDVTGIGPGPTEAMIGGRIPKAGLLDPFFGTAPHPPSVRLR